jgi:DNA-binding protein YbaB
MTEESLRGQGGSADGLARAIVTADGRLADLHLEPQLLERDTATVADVVRGAVNAAHDDVAEKARQNSAFGTFDAELDRITQGFERALDKATQDLEQARKRLEE